MNISDKTVDILKNFATINQGLVFDTTDELATMSPSHTVLAVAKLETPFPKEFAIYDLNLFLGVLDLFDKPTFKFADNYLMINGKTSQSIYRFADPQTVSSPKKKTLDMEDELLTFELKADVLDEVLKAARVMQRPNIVFTCDGTNVMMQATDVNDSLSHTYKKVVLTDQKAIPKFRNVMKIEYFKLLSATYQVTLSTRMTVFENDTMKYYVVVESND
jgi:hypothetical protein